MHATFEVTSGMAIGRRLVVVPGPPTVVGKSAGATFSLPNETKLAEDHFTIGWEDGVCVLRSLVEGATYVNGDQSADAELKTGDHITAGATGFTAVQVQDAAAEAEAAKKAECCGAPVAAAPGAAPVAATAAAGPPPPPEPPRTGPALLAWLGLEEDVQEKVEKDQTAEQMIRPLELLREYPAALRVQAHVLGARNAVWWGLLCVKEVLGEPLPEAEAPCFAAALAWVASPEEKNRRAAETAAKESENKGLAVWPATGAFWAEGSIAPPDQAGVPPDERLAGQVVAAGLNMAGYEGDPTLAPQRFQAFLAKAKEVADGKHPFPAPAAGSAKK